MLNTNPAFYFSAGDMAAVPHNYMLGAFTYGWFAGVNAAEYIAEPNAHGQFSELDQVRLRVSSNECLRPFFVASRTLQD